MIILNKLLEKRRRKLLSYYYEQYQKNYKEYRWRKDNIDKINSYHHCIVVNSGLKEQSEIYLKQARYWKNKWRQMQKKLNLR